MSIDRIAKLRDCGVFRDFQWSSDLPEFGRYNLIYGWNGSGKTTISRVFRALENRTSPPMGQVSLVIEGHSVAGEDLTHVTLPVRVFNRDFVMETVFPVGGGEVPPIFVVGKESVEKQKEVERLKGERARAEADLAAAKLAEQNAERDLDRMCIERAKVIKDTLRSSGSSAYNNYDKSNFRDRALKMVADGDEAIYRLTEADRENLLAQHRATPKRRVQAITYKLPAFQPLADAASELLSTTVVSAAIQSLRDDPVVSAWVRQGLGLHQERGAEKCLFCEQILPKERLAALEGHFSAEYEQFMTRLDDEIAGLRAKSKAISELALPKPAEFYDDLTMAYEAAEAELREALGVTRGFLDSLAQVLTGKKGRPFQSVALDVTVPGAHSGAVDRLNEIIASHNNVCDDFQGRVNAARLQLEADSVASEIAEFGRVRGAIQAAEIASGNGTTSLDQLSATITDLEREIVDHLRPAEELNLDLLKYLGHGELSLERKQAGYTIVRGGVEAPALSEGETTAIALLYFLKSLQDRRFDLTKGVVVLDDPVSSLDANALYLAFGFIRERTQDAAQLFILTHNFAFFRAVRNWFHNLRGNARKAVRFYMLECSPDGDSRRSDIRRLDRLLERYESEYHYLFARILRATRVKPPSVLEDNYILPNMARRLLEAFLAFRQPQVSGELWQKMNRAHFDEAKKLRIYRFLQAYSHSGGIVEPEHDPSLLGEAQAVLKDLLDLIKAEDPAHFAAMEELVGQCADEGSGE